MSKNNSELSQKDEERLRRIKKRKRKKARKNALMIFSFIIIALAAFVITVKILKPDVTVKSFLPEKTYNYINENVLKNTTTTETEPTQTTEATTTKPAGRYLPIEEFAFDKDKKGNLLGNVLAGGKAWHDDTYIYHIIDGDGIYRFYPSDETFTRIYQSGAYLSNLNINDTHLFFTNDSDKKLYTLKKGESTATPIAENIKTAYLYDSTLYCVTYAGGVTVMSTDGSGAKTLYSSSGEEVQLVGISLGRVYFTAKDSYGTLRFWTIDKEGKEEKVMFREVANVKDFISPVLEDGFLYYYTPNSDGTFDLHRQKFGSENVVDLIEGAAVSQYAIVENQRLFYAHRDGSQFIVKEMNMNNGEKRVLLKSDNVTDDNSLIFQHGGTYDFIIGYRNAKSWVCFASCVNTSSENVMHFVFDEGKWTY